MSSYVHICVENAGRVFTFTEGSVRLLKYDREKLSRSAVVCKEIQEWRSISGETFTDVSSATLATDSNGLSDDHNV